MDGVYTMVSSSASSLFGNVGCAVREFILSKFPKDYFKYVNVSSEIAFRNLRRQFGSNTKKEFNKREKPYLIIQPEYQVPDSDSFLQGVPLTANWNDTQYRVDPRYLFNVINDKKQHYRLHYKLNRDRIDFEVRVVVASLHQQLDIYKAMVNQITWGHTITLETALEAVIPKTIIYYIGKLSRIDVMQDPNQVPLLLEHLNRNATYPITYKLRNASASDEYFMYYKHNLFITFYDLNLEEGNKKNMVDDHYDVTFRVSVEFNMPGLFIISGDMKQYNGIKAQLISIDTTGENGEDEFIPLFTLNNLYTQYPLERNGLRYYASSRFTTDPQVKMNDMVDISTIFDNDHKNVIRFYDNYKMDIHTLLDIIVLQDNTELIEGTDYLVNWNRLELTILKPDSFATYRFVVYCNNVIYNDIAISLIEEGRNDKAYIKENHIPQKDPIVKDDISYLPTERVQIKPSPWQTLLGNSFIQIMNEIPLDKDGNLSYVIVTQPNDVAKAVIKSSANPTAIYTFGRLRQETIWLDIIGYGVYSEIIANDCLDTIEWKVDATGADLIFKPTKKEIKVSIADKVVNCWINIYTPGHLYNIMEVVGLESEIELKYSLV